MTTISNGESGLSVRNKLNDIWAGLELNAYDTSIAATAVDVFVYDTSKDSDGGAWRKRTQHTSWYNETLNTATRGARREFPAVAVIVAESDTVTIYDGDDPSLPMWRVEDYTGLTIRAAVAINGQVWIGASTGVIASDYAGDDLGSTTLDYTTVTTPAIVNNSCNDIATTVLPDAQIDSTTGLPVPTIAVATAGGVSVIRDDGTVADITCANAGFTASTIVDFKGSQLWMNQGNAGSVDSVFVFNTPPTADTALTLNSKTGTGADADAYYKEHPTLGDLTLVGDSSNDLVNAIAKGSVGSNDGLTRIYENPTTPASGMVAYTTSTYNTGWMNGDIKGAFLSDTDDTDLVGSDVVINGGFATDADWTKGTGWTIASNVASSDGSQTADSDLEQAVTTVVGKQYILQFTVSNYSAGNVAGVIDSTEIVADKAANGSYSGKFTATSTSHTVKIRADLDFVGDIDDVSFSLADADRSVNNNGLIVNGTVTRTAVATGADLVAYSGFSASNYLEQPYNSDLDFGTGDFCVMGWFKEAANSAVETILERDSATTAQRFTLAVNASGFLTFTCDDDTTARTATSTIAIDNGTWTHFVATYDGAGGLRIYLNGALNDTETGAALLTLNNAAAVLRVGLAVDDAEPLTNGNLALLRISATAPTAEQIKKIYEDEKFLFQDGAQATLYGASDAVTALAHDPVTDLLHVGTSAGRSVFQGLRRVSNTTTAVGTAISASNGLIAEE